MKCSLGSVPDKPFTPEKVELLSLQTSIALVWEQNLDKVTRKLTGYKLYMDDGYNGNFRVIYDGTGFPNTRSFTA